MKQIWGLAPDGPDRTCSRSRVFSNLCLLAAFISLTFKKKEKKKRHFTSKFPPQVWFYTLKMILITSSSGTSHPPGMWFLLISQGVFFFFCCSRLISKTKPRKSSCSSVRHTLSFSLSQWALVPVLWANYAACIVWLDNILFCQSVSLCKVSVYVCNFSIWWDRHLRERERGGEQMTR